MNAAASQAYQAGLQAFERSDLTGAQTQLAQALAADPTAYQAHFALGTVYDRQQQVAEARQSYRAALDIVADYEPAIREMAGSFLRRGMLSEAESFLVAQRTRAPESAAVLAALAEVRSLQKDSDKAQELARQALKKDPDYRPAMVVLARDHYRNRRLDLALYTLTAILDGYGAENPPRDKDNAQARLLRSLIYKEQGARNNAITELRHVVQARPDIVEARLNLAAFMLEAGNAAEAVPLLEGALIYEPLNPLIHLNLGDAYRLQGRPKESLTQLDWVTKAAPNLAETYYNIGLVYMLSAGVEGVTEEQAVDYAIVALEKYLSMQSSARPKAGDDAEELLKRAKSKKAVLEAMKGSGGDDGFQ
jgi:Tfp pilus assembly protein PilF